CADRHPAKRLSARDGWQMLKAGIGLRREEGRTWVQSQELWPAFLAESDRAIRWAGGGQIPLRP
ncbi:MAG: hypothetical protein P8Z30_11765, partial [Acidobacteriota bacterium]